VLALSAAARGVPITRLVAYEPPFIVDDSRPRPAADLADRLRTLVAAGRRGDAVERFLVEGVDIPAPAVASMRAQPTWADREAFAPTLVYELAVCGPGQSIPVDEMARIRIPTLVLDGGASPEWARRSVAAVAAAIPGARHQTLDGQDHGVADEVLAPLLVEYLT
jgi:pimeloyl-ACP methyl ester carboxylesterase